jgi:hypothetical protein
MIKVKELLVVRYDMDVNKHERLSNITLRHRFKMNEQIVVRNDMDVNEHERNVGYSHVYLHPYPVLLQAVHSF